MVKTTNLAVKLFIIFLFSFLDLYADKKVVLQLSWLHQFQFAGYYVAKEKGFYKDLGLDVEIKEFEYGLDLRRCVVEHKADFAVGRSSLLIDKSNGLDVIALGAIFQKSPMVLLVTKESGIEGFEDFRGKSIMITSDAKSSASIIAMLKSNGIGLDDVTIQKHSFNLDDLISGKTDAMASYISNEPIRLSDKDIDYKVFNPSHYGYDFYDDILFTSSEYYQSNTKDTKKFYDATIRGWKYAFEHIDETSEIIFNKYNSQNKSKLQIMKEGEILKQIAFDYFDNEIGCLDKNKLEKIVNVYKVLGFIQGEVDLDELVYQHNNHGVYSFELSKKQLIPVVIIFGIVIVILIFLFLVMKKVKTWFGVMKMLKQELEEKIKDIEYQKGKLSQVDARHNDSLLVKDENLNIIDCNQKFSNLFCKDKDQIIGKNDYFLFDEETASVMAQIQEEVLLTQKRQDFFIEKTVGLSIEHSLSVEFLPFQYSKEKIGLILFFQERKNEK